MPRRRRTTSTRSTTAPPSSASTRARSSRRRSSASPCSRCSCPRFPRTTRKARCTSTTCSTSDTGVLRATRTLDEHVPQLADVAGRSRRRRSEGGAVRRRLRASVRSRRGGDAAVRRGRRASRRARRRRSRSREVRRPSSPGSCCSRWRVCSRSTCGRSRGASGRRAGCASATSGRSCSMLRWVKQRVTDQFISAGKRRKKATPIAASALTPKAGRQRDPAKTLAGTEFREANETRELVTVLGRSGKPIILGPWLSETGFELLYWIPFLTWAKTYGNFDPERLVVVSRGGAAPWYRHITPHYEEIFSFYTPDEFRVANERRIVEQQGRQKHIEISSFDREILARVQAKRGLSGAEVLHPSQMYQLFDHFWLQRDAGDAGRGVLGVRADSAAASVGHPRAASRAVRRGEVLRQRRAAADAREPRVRDQLSGRPRPACRRRPAEHRAAVRRSRRLSAWPPRPPALDRAPDDAGEQPRGADRSHPRRPRLRRHLWRLLVSGAAVRHEHAGVLFAPERVPLRPPRGRQARVLRRCAAARSPRSTCARRRSSGSDSPAPTSARSASSDEALVDHRRQPRPIRGAPHDRAAALAGQRHAVVLQGPVEEDAKRLARRPPRWPKRSATTWSTPSRCRIAPCGARCARRRAGKRT